MTARRRWLVAGLVSAAIALMQVAWLAVIPPFGGMDEFDHVYRAASVARGHLTDAQPSPEARGELIRVPADIVTAAHHRCEVLKYTAPGNCEAQSAPDSDGSVLVASAASRYNPAYYAVVGVAARPFSGRAALLAMRLVTALMADLLLVSALVIAVRHGRSWWPSAAMMIGLTPVIVYASVIVAPNAIQMAAGVLMWSSGLALAGRGDISLRAQAKLLVALAVAVSAVLVTHTSGPLWAALSLVALSVIAGRRRLVELAQQTRRTMVGTVVAVSAVALATASWIVMEKPNDPSTAGASFPAPTAHDLLSQVPLWLFQTVGGIPFRDQAPPAAAAALAVVVFVGLIVLALRVWDRRVRIVILSVAILMIAIPLALSLATWRSVGPSWQGRYTLPLALGIPLAAGWALDRPPTSLDRSSGTTGALVWCAAIIEFAVVELMTQLHVRHAVEGPSWSSGDGHQPPLLVFAIGAVGALVALGVAATLVVGSWSSDAALGRRTRATTSTTEESEVFA